MKKNLPFRVTILIALSLANVHFAYAQQNEKRFKAGMSLGAVVSDVNGADARDGDNDFRKIGYTGGIFVNTALNQKNILQFEINYITKGSMTPPDSNNNGYFKIVLGYIEVPILVRHKINFNIKKKPVEKFELEGGLSVGRLVNHDVIGAANYSIPDFGNLFNSTDVSIVGGIDYNFTKNVYLCVRYSNSVIPALKKNVVVNPQFIRYTFNKGNNMVFQFSLKFTFGNKNSETTPAKVLTN